jgi:putative transposase
MYKAEWNDKSVIKINRFFPSSKTCSKCGWKNNNLTLKDRKWICKECGEILDRDVNAAINILKEGLKIFGQGLSNTKVERKSDFSNKAYSMKPETH